MISRADKPYSEEESLGVLNEYVRDWFNSGFGELTPPQRYAFKLIGERKNVLIAAPTGSGKTMSGFTSIISRLFDYSLEGKLEDRIYCLYVSPLRALNNDIHRNLSKPLDEIYGLMKKKLGTEIIKRNIRQVTIGVRTGDTSQKERRQQLLKPPNILVTTPESLAILINSDKFMENMKGLEYLIVDEIHELANNKRGVHLSLSVARLENLIGGRLVKIGLGATLHPLDEAARFLVGYRNGEPDDCTIVDASWSKKLDLKAISPVTDMIYTPEEEIEAATYKEIDRIIKASKSTLIFTNTRSGTERVVFNLKKRYGYGEDIAAHHSSLSRESRLDVEELLKKGSLKCAVSSTSLELGVDVGAIENVVQLGSPKSVTRAIQRIGRAGHSYKATAKGETIVLNRDDLIECTIMLDAAIKKHLDTFRVPQNALDVLAQHIMGMSLNRKWNVDEAFELVRNAYAYHDLPREDFDGLMGYLAGNYVGLESRRVYGKIWYDETTRMFGKRGYAAKVIYMLNLGTIPDEVAVDVFDTKKKWIGSIEEEFLAKLKPGDIFTLGGKLYQFEYAKEMRCYVTDAQTKSPTIPPWYSEQLPLSFELAMGIGDFRARMAQLMGKQKRVGRAANSGGIPKAIAELLDPLPADQNSKLSIYNYFVEQRLFAGEIPTSKMVLVEVTQDSESEKDYIIFHSLFGRRINDALSRAFGASLADFLDMDIGIMVNDNGFVMIPEEKVRLSEGDLKKIVSEIHDVGLSKIIKSNISGTELMKRKFRHVAARSFMILRNYKGHKISVKRQQFNSQLVFKAAEAIDPNFPVIKETYREIMDDVMDLPRAGEIIDAMKKGDIKIRLVKTPAPSPFSHNMITFGQADAVLMKDRHAHLQRLHKMVMEEIGG
ncbi:MAG: ATP-dependent helicase [Candidatus Micrarchaeota archaeon]|nr:ATP-dependent helicase [Candidatus Micrarchaeota archaeon]